MSGTARPLLRRLFRRGPWEAAAIALIGAGVFMLLQPFSLAAYSWSFATTLTGVILYTVVTKFPD